MIPLRYGEWMQKKNPPLGRVLSYPILFIKAVALKTTPLGPTTVYSYLISLSSDINSIDQESTKASFDLSNPLLLASVLN